MRTSRTECRVVHPIKFVASLRLDSWTVEGYWSNLEIFRSDSLLVEPAYLFKWGEYTYLLIQQRVQLSWVAILWEGWRSGFVNRKWDNHIIAETYLAIHDDTNALTTANVLGVHQGCCICMWVLSYQGQLLIRDWQQLARRDKVRNCTPASDLAITKGTDILLSAT